MFEARKKHDTEGEVVGLLFIKRILIANSNVTRRKKEEEEVEVGGVRVCWVNYLPLSLSLSLFSILLTNQLNVGLPNK